MRWTLSVTVAAVAVIAAGADLSAQKRSAGMSVSVTVKRSTPAGETSRPATADSGTASAQPGGSAENPTPAPPRESETQVVIAAPATTEAATSVMMLTINY